MTPVSKFKRSYIQTFDPVNKENVSILNIDRINRRQIPLFMHLLYHNILKSVACCKFRSKMTFDVRWICAINRKVVFWVLSRKISWAASKVLLLLHGFLVVYSSHGSLLCLMTSYPEGFPHFWKCFCLNTWEPENPIYGWHSRLSWMSF